MYFFCVLFMILILFFFMFSFHFLSVSFTTDVYAIGISFKITKNTRYINFLLCTYGRFCVRLCLALSDDASIFIETIFVQMRFKFYTSSVFTISHKRARRRGKRSYAMLICILCILIFGVCDIFTYLPVGI